MAIQKEKANEKVIESPEIDSKKYEGEGKKLYFYPKAKTMGKNEKDATNRTIKKDSKKA